MNTPNPELSVVIPFYNEEGNVLPLLFELEATLPRLTPFHEVICINDGSTDGTGEALIEAQMNWPNIRVDTPEHNVGQMRALVRGFLLSKSDWIAMLDGDGQNPPVELEKLWNLRNEASMIVGIRKNRDDHIGRIVMSRIANLVRSVVLSDGLHDAGCALKLFRQEIVGVLPLDLSLHAFMPACAKFEGFTVIETPVAHRNRRFGKAKFGFGNMALSPMLEMFRLRRRFMHEYEIRKTAA